MIKGNEDHFSVGMMCRMLSVSRRVGEIGHSPAGIKPTKSWWLKSSVSLMTKKAGRTHPESPSGFKKKAIRPVDTV
ncbi:MAG: hypothetical protein WC504_16080 [Methylobacter sp.]